MHVTRLAAHIPDRFVFQFDAQMQSFVKKKVEWWSQKQDCAKSRPKDNLMVHQKQWSFLFAEVKVLWKGAKTGGMFSFC